MNSQNSASALVGLTAATLIKVLGAPLYASILVGAGAVLLTKKAIDKYAQA